MKKYAFATYAESNVCQKNFELFFEISEKFVDKNAIKRCFREIVVVHYYLNSDESLDFGAQSVGKVKKCSFSEVRYFSTLSGNCPHFSTRLRNPSNIFEMNLLIKKKLKEKVLANEVKKNFGHIPGAFRIEIVIKRKNIVFKGFPSALEYKEFTP